MLTGLRELIRQYALANPRMSRDILKQWLGMNSARKLLERFTIDYPMEYRERQHMLELDSLEEMYEYAGKLLIEDTNVSRIKEELSEKVKEKVDKHQKEYILREQLKVLNEELDGEDDGSEIEEFCDAVKELEAAAEIKEKIRKEIKRYKILSQGSAEANVERGYIETLLEMPWDKMSEDNRDLDAAAQVLDEDHYGMKKIKERILESLAVRNITSKGDAPILCLVGPPGTGKTSIARSVAKALNKKYVRICLGGVRDEAEIRGHRKTYVGAMPGRIITAFKAAGVKNPLMLLDEIDKISSDYKGDTASALLEVLDSEQNSHFVDHYIELPTDLSQVLFIATANDLSTVSRPLLDRMEIIEVSSYTKNEKLHIAKEHLVPKQLEKNGLMAKQLKFSDKALESMIDGYTREAGVRSLEREIAKVCRKAVRQLYHGNGELNEEVKSIRITDKNLKDFLGKVKFKGIDIAANAGWRFGTQWSIDTRINYTYQKAQDYSSTDDLYYKGQIPYVPLHNGSAVINAGYRNWELNYSFIYTGERYASRANTEENYVLPWYTSDLSLSKNLRWHKTGIRITAEINNLFNQQYEVVHSYPMPGTNFKLILNVTL